MSAPKQSLAGLLVTKDYDDAVGTFHMLEAMTDWTCVLDDNSRVCFPFRDDCDEYLSLRRGTLWNDVGNRTMLLYRAYLAGFPKVISSGGDVLPSAALFRDIRAATYGDDFKVADVIFAPFRELWGDIYHYRVDGLWMYKWCPAVQHNWFWYAEMTMQMRIARLHDLPFPSNLEPTVKHFPPSMAVYHFGSMTEEARQARQDKYLREDFEHRKDYTYLNDKTGLELAETPKEDVAFMEAWIKDRKIIKPC